MKEARANLDCDSIEFVADGFPVSELVLEKDLVSMNVESLEAELPELILVTGFYGFNRFAKIGSAASAYRICRVTKSTSLVGK